MDAVRRFANTGAADTAAHVGVYKDYALARQQADDWADLCGPPEGGDSSLNNNYNDNTSRDLPPNKPHRSLAHISRRTQVCNPESPLEDQKECQYV